MTINFTLVKKKKPKHAHTNWSQLFRERSGKQGCNCLPCVTHICGAPLVCLSGGGTVIALSAVKSHTRGCSKNKDISQNLGRTRPAALATQEGMKGAEAAADPTILLIINCMSWTSHFSFVSQCLHFWICKMGIIFEDKHFGEDTLETVDFCCC